MEQTYLPFNSSAYKKVTLPFLNSKMILMRLCLCSLYWSSQVIVGITLTHREANSTRPNLLESIWRRPNRFINYPLLSRYLCLFCKYFDPLCLNKLLLIIPPPASPLSQTKSLNNSHCFTIIALFIVSQSISSTPNPV